MASFSTVADTRNVLGDAALDHRPIRLEPLPRGLQAELVESAEQRQIGRGESSVEHVEVFRMGSVGTSILEDLDSYPAKATRDTRTPPTLNYEEPSKLPMG